MTTMQTNLIGKDQADVRKEFIEYRKCWVPSSRSRDQWKIMNWMTGQKLEVKFNVYGKITEYHWN